MVQAAPALVDLNVNGCIHLTRLLLPSNLSLAQLDVSGCGMLRQLDSPASSLQSLTAHGCDHLHVSWSAGAVFAVKAGLMDCDTCSCTATSWHALRPSCTGLLHEAGQELGR